MADLPKPMPTSAADETVDGLAHHIGSEWVPVLTVDVSRTAVYFEHHILL